MQEMNEVINVAAQLIAQAEARFLDSCAKYSALGAENRRLEAEVERLRAELEETKNASKSVTEKSAAPVKGAS